MRLVDAVLAPGPPVRKKRLRLAELLAELGALDDEVAAASASEVRSITHVTLGDIVDLSEEAGFGLLVAMLALIAIPFFGLSTPFGLAMALCGAQMFVARRKPWLPKLIRRRKLSLSMLDRVANLLARRTRFLARIARPRGEFLLVGPGWVAIGLGILLLGLGLALPLPIPGSNLIFLVPLLVYAIGILERDGLLIVIGHVATLANMALILLFGGLVWEALVRAWAWIVT